MHTRLKTLPPGMAPAGAEEPPDPRRVSAAQPDAGTSEPGPVELTGRVRPLSLLVSPLSGQACVLYDLRLTLWQRLTEVAAQGGSREVAGARFLLDCRLGEVLVDAGAARLHLGWRTRHRVRPREDLRLRHRLGSLYHRLGRGPSLPMTVTAVERLLVPGQRIWLRGPVCQIPDARGEPDGYRLPPMRLLLRAEELFVL